MASLTNSNSDDETDEDEFHDAVGGGESEDEDEETGMDGWMEDVGMPRHRSSSRKIADREQAACQASDGTFADATATELTPAQQAMAARYGGAAEDNPKVSPPEATGTTKAKAKAKAKAKKSRKAAAKGPKSGEKGGDKAAPMACEGTWQDVSR